MQWPSDKAQQKIRDTIKEHVQNRKTLKMSMKEMIQWLNARIRGWRNYYGVTFARKVLWKLDKYILRRFTIWLNQKHQKRKRLGSESYYFYTLRAQGLLMLSEIAC